MEITELFPWLIGGGTFLITIVAILCSTLPFLLIFGGLGYFLYKQNQKAKAVQQASLAWRQTTGTVIRSRVEVSGGETTSVSPRIIYQYEVNGQTYQNDQLKAGDRFWRVTSSQSAYETVDRYHVGLQVTVFYNPNNPAESALER